MAKKCNFFECRDDSVDQRSKFILHKLLKKMEDLALNKKMEELTLKKKIEGESSCIEAERDIEGEFVALIVSNPLTMKR
ncbi:hypothetical protein RND71_008152 [Anisodus tanguticus]|uniref:Uncharacterized protein n=1 Tax=Anisodus tanguticus TaxID=243964 RepID=A0AAE1SNL7_9SOLA|nr:hypothetical protein RND71_008152 [Anisodus tanguticus]